MQTTYLACGIFLGILVSSSPVAQADQDMQSALANCREEAVSTGLQEQPDIQAYINLCMQAWQTPDSSVPLDSTLETNPEAQVAEPPPEETPENAAQAQ